MKRKILALILMMTLIFSFTMTGCGNGDAPAPEPEEVATEPDPEPEPDGEEPEPAGEEPAPAADGVTRIGISLDTLDDPYWVGLMTGIDEAIAELGDRVEVNVQIAQGDASVQNRQIEDMISAGVDALLVVYVDQEAIVQSIRLANENDVPFIFADRPVDSSPGAEVAWGRVTDCYALSVQAWEWMVEYTRGLGMEEVRVLEVIGSLADANVLRRTNGFETVMDANPGFITRVQSIPSEWNLEMALAGVTNALQANPDIDVIFMHSDFLLAPIIQALEAAGRWVPIGEEGHIIVMPYSGNSLSLRVLYDGYVPMVIGMNTFMNGYETLMAAFNIANGDTAGYDEPVEDPGFILTLDNWDVYAPIAYGWPGFVAGE